MPAETYLSTWNDSTHIIADLSVTSDEKCDPKLDVKEPSLVRTLVTMLACVFILTCSMGLFFTLGIIYVELIDYFDTPRSEAALVQSMHFGFCQGGGLLFTKLVTKYDTGFVTVGASCVAAICLCSCAFAPTIHVVIVLNVLTGLACSIYFLVSFVVVGWMFQKNRNLALAILTIGTGIGQIVLPYVITALIDRYFWTGAVIILGGFLYLNCIPCGLLIHFAEPYFQKGDATKVEESKLLDPMCFSDAAFMIFLSTCLTFSATGPVEQLFVVDMSVLKGFSVDGGATLLSLIGVFGLIGQCICTLILRIVPNTRPELHLTYAYFIWGMGHIIISQSPVYWGMVLGIVIRGLATGIMVGFFHVLQADIRGLEMFPETLSISNFLVGIGFILAGFLGGLSFDLTKSYNLIFYAASGVNIFNALSMLLIFFIFKHRRGKYGYTKLL